MKFVKNEVDAFIDFLRAVALYIRNILGWFIPFGIFIILIWITFYLIASDREGFFKSLEILAWPVTVLMIAFFFRKALTYLFFSMEQLNLFGIKGELKSVHSTINAEVERKLRKKEEELQRIAEVERLRIESHNKQSSIQEAHESTKQAVRLADDLMQEQTEMKDMLVQKEKDIENLKQVIKIYEGGHNINP